MYISVRWSGRSNEKKLTTKRYISIFNVKRLLEIVMNPPLTIKIIKVQEVRNAENVIKFDDDDNSITNNVNNKAIISKADSSGEISAEAPTPTRSSSLPAWLISSFASVEKFKKTAAKTRESINRLQKTCRRFDEIKRKSDEYFAERERLLNMRQTNKKERECAPIELLPTEMYGKIFLYLTSEDILELVLVTKTLRVVFENEDEKCWQPLAANRWYLKKLDNGIIDYVHNNKKNITKKVAPMMMKTNSTIDKNNNNNNNNDSLSSWRLSCLIRCAGMSEINRLLKKYRHGRIPKTSNGSQTAQQEWINALTGLIFLCNNKYDIKTRDIICTCGGARFLLGLSGHNSHWIRRISVGALANLLTCTIDEKNQMHQSLYNEIEKNNGGAVLRDLLCSPVAEVETMASQEAARCLINMNCSAYPVIANERELLLAHEWNILRTHSSNRKQLFKIPFNFSSSISNNNNNDNVCVDKNNNNNYRWRMLHMYQSGSRKGIDEHVSFCFTLDGKVLGSGCDNDRGVYFLSGEWYGLEAEDGMNVSSKAGSIFMKKWYGITREIAMESGSPSTFYRGFWYSGSKDGFFGCWENNMSGFRRRSMKLVHGGGIFRAVPMSCMKNGEF